MKLFFAALLSVTIYVDLACCQTENTKKHTGIAESLKQLEASGELPILDRSTSLSGIDTNKNGVRDDIEKYISSLTDTTIQKKALLQYSKALNAEITTDIKDKQKIIEAAQKSMAATKCIWIVYNESVAPEKSEEIRKYTLNTQERILASTKFDQALNGESFVLPRENTCESSDKKDETPPNTSKQDQELLKVDPTEMAKLRKSCEMNASQGDNECCLKSLEHMIQNHYTPFRGRCPAGYKQKSNSCFTSLTWCQP